MGIGSSPCFSIHLKFFKIIFNGRKDEGCKVSLRSGAPATREGVSDLKFPAHWNRSVDVAPRQAVQTCGAGEQSEHSSRSALWDALRTRPPLQLAFLWLLMCLWDILRSVPPRPC